RPGWRCFFKVRVDRRFVGRAMASPSRDFEGHAERWAGDRVSASGHTENEIFEASRPNLNLARFEDQHSRLRHAHVPTYTPDADIGAPQRTCKDFNLLKPQQCRGLTHFGALRWTNKKGLRLRHPSPCPAR